MSIDHTIEPLSNAFVPLLLSRFSFGPYTQKASPIDKFHNILKCQIQFNMITPNYLTQTNGTLVFERSKILS
jgi:hypothetical protein